MALYCISDLHLSLGADKPMDVFPGWDGYVDKLKHNWISTVKPEDTVVVAGDISWAMKLDETYEDLKFLNDLPGKKILIKGNHDYWWATAKKINDFFVKNKFDTLSIIFNSAVCVDGIWICGSRGWMNSPQEEADKKIYLREVQRFKTSVDAIPNDAKDIVAFLHYPPVYGTSEAKEFVNILIERNIKKCYYGHIHGSEAAKKVLNKNYKGIEFKLISCDYIDFCPVLVAK